MEIDITSGFLSWGYALFILVGALALIHTLKKSDGQDELRRRVAELERRVLELQPSLHPYE
jgi:hypothetical protein